MVEKEVIIGGNKIRYVEKQGGDEVAFIFLHGWGSDYTVFTPLYEQTDTMVAFDFPGCGGSSKLNKVWGLAEYADTVQAIIEKTLSTKKLIFVAHSFGGRVLLKMLNQKPRDDVEQVVCIGVPFIRADVGKLKALQWSARVAGMVGPYLPKPMTRKARKIWHKIIGAKDYGAMDNEIMKKTFQNILDEDITELTGVLKQYKTNFIWGEHDTAAPLSDAASVAGESGAALHVIKDGDHFPFLGKTQNNFIETFKHITHV